MNNNRKTGEKGEQLALEYLLGKGYILIEKNWRTGRKEIDLIFRQEDVFIFVEVKTRNSVLQGMPEESITESKIRSVTEAAEIFLYDKKYRDIRFDVISIIFDRNGLPEILHIPDAFY